MLKTTPYKFQLEATNQIMMWGGRGLIGDSPGLGKTLSSLMYLDNFPGKRPAIVVCPAHAKYGWKRQSWKHVGIKAVVVGTQTPNLSEIKNAEMVIINYDVLPFWWRTLRKINPKVIIGDEVQALCSVGAKRTKAFKQLQEDVPHLIALSGTPINNRPIEFFSILNMIDPAAWPNMYSYGHEFCGARRNRFSGRWDFKGATRTKRLHRILTSTIMIRRLKEDVLKDLPPKMYNTVPLKLSKTDMKEYRLIRDDVAGWLRRNYSDVDADRAMKTEALQKVNVLRQTAARLKLPYVLEWVKTFLQSGEKLLIFGVHKKFVRAVHETFHKRAVLVNGSVTGKKRQEAFDAFNDDKKCKLLSANIIAGGTAWSAYSCSNVAIGELPWRPSDVGQAIDRAHGIGRGQVGVPTTAWMLIAEGTMEIEMLKSLKVKEKSLNAVLDGRATTDEDLFQNVVNSLLENR